MADSENSLRIINGLPHEIQYDGLTYELGIGKIPYLWLIYYELGDETCFLVHHKTIEQAALEMHEILIENNLYK